MNINIGLKVQPLMNQEERKPKPDVSVGQTLVVGFIGRSYVFCGTSDQESGRFHSASATNPVFHSSIPSTSWSQSLICIKFHGTGWFVVRPLSAFTARHSPKAHFSCFQLLMLASPNFLSESFVSCLSLLAFKKNIHAWHIIKIERDCAGISQAMPLLNAVAGV